ncbi:exonuclease [Xylariales sp. AK1849]|nr:exonuclease [Xylariales sp. AK1849]
MLKHLPCPAGQTCTAFQCLFKHDTDDDVNSSTENTGQHVAEKEASIQINQDSPRKRLKLTPELSHLQVASSKLPASISAKPEEDKKNNRPTSKPSSVQTMPISPPSIKRKAPLPIKQTDKNENTPPAHKFASPASSQKSSNVTAPSQQQPKAGPKKPETLNPRHLQSSPARHDTRWKLVRLLHEQYVRLNAELKKTAKEHEAELLMSDQELIVKTLDDEEEIAIQRPAIYDNVVKNRVMRYKRMSIDQWKEERIEAATKAKGEVATTEDAPKLIETGLNPAQEVDFLHRLSTDLTGYERFGYISAAPKDEDIEKAKNAVEASGNIEVCDRCTRRFTVFPGRREEDGALTSGGPCIHHPGKAYFMDRAPGDRSQSQKKWRCCEQTVGDTDGCTTGKDHVFKVTDPSRLASILNFAKTPPNPNVPVDRAVGFDCEMGYTAHGMELIRVTAVSWPAGDELLDILVYPIGEYIDLNTRYSGVRPEDMVAAERWRPGDDPSPTVIPSADALNPPQRKLKIVPSPKDARDLMFSLISPDTPLVGHGLENDLNAMRIIHPVVVDTVLLFPHKRGLPIRNGLKWLMQNMLDRKIQMNTSTDEGTPQGHDSAEDARAAGELARLKVRDEWKRLQMKGWTMAEDGSLKPPDDSWMIVGGKKTKRFG